MSLLTEVTELERLSVSLLESSSNAIVFFKSAHCYSLSAQDMQRFPSICLCGKKSQPLHCAYFFPNYCNILGRHSGVQLQFFCWLFHCLIGLEVGQNVRFLQHAQCSHCKHCISYSNSVCLSVCPSVRPSHAGIVSKRRHVARCSLHRWIAKCV